MYFWGWHCSGGWESKMLCVFETVYSGHYFLTLISMQFFTGCWLLSIHKLSSHHSSLVGHLQSYHGCHCLFCFLAFLLTCKKIWVQHNSHHTCHQICHTYSGRCPQSRCLSFWASLCGCCCCCCCGRGCRGCSSHCLANIIINIIASYFGREFLFSPNSCRHGHTENRNWHGGFLSPNQYWLPPAIEEWSVEHWDGHLVVHLWCQSWLWWAWRRWGRGARWRRRMRSWLSRPACWSAARGTPAAAPPGSCNPAQSSSRTAGGQRSRPASCSKNIWSRSQKYLK